MDDISLVLREHAEKLKKALKHLRYSAAKVRRLPTDPERLSEEGLADWESFSARFARVVDLFLTKYVRACVLREYPGFEGSLRDFVNQAEKLGLIKSAERWIAMRELRNITAHEYNDKELASFLKSARNFAPEALRLEQIFRPTRGK